MYRRGSCYYGQLTDIGRDYMDAFGRSIRQLYIEYLQFLPATWTKDAASSFYFRTTSFPRTIETLQSVFTGLYPPQDRSMNQTSDTSESIPIQVHTRQEELENMYPWAKCSRLRVLQKQFKALAHKLFSKDVEYLQDKLRHLLSVPDSFGAYSSFHGIYDTLYSAKLHNYDLKREYNVEEKDFLRLEKFVSDEWFYGFMKSEEMVRLGIGRFLRDILLALREKAMSINAAVLDSLPVDPPTGLRLFPFPAYPNIASVKAMFFSGHDSTLAPLMSAFGVFDGLWPSFGAHCTLELLEDLAPDNASSSDSFYVRLKTNDRIVSIPACAGYYHPNDSSLCRLDQFFKITSPLIPRDLAEECAVESS